MNMQERLNSAVDMAETDTGLLHDIVHGDETKLVPTENGDVPSVAKVIKDIRDQIHGNTTDLVKQAETAAIMATERANDCTVIKSEVQNLAGSANSTLDTIKVWAEGTDEEVAEHGGLHSCKTWVDLAQKETIGSYPRTIRGIAANGQTLLPLPTMLMETEQILSVIIENTILLPDTYRLSEDRKSVELVNPLSSGERWSVKFLTEFQSVASLAGTVLYEDMETSL